MSVQRLPRFQQTYSNKNFQHFNVGIINVRIKKEWAGVNLHFLQFLIEEVTKKYLIPRNSDLLE